MASAHPAPESAPHFAPCRRRCTLLVRFAALRREYRLCGAVDVCEGEDAAELCADFPPEAASLAWERFYARGS